MKKNYVQTSLSSYLNESKTITLKRGYGERQPVVVGTNAPLRNQILNFVAESNKVSKVELKRFIAGLNEGSKNPIAAANMWLQRNSQFFIAENKNGITYYKLSTVGKRLAGSFSTNSVSESNNVRNIIEKNGKRLNEAFEKSMPQIQLSDEESEGAINIPNTDPDAAFYNRYKLVDGRIVDVDPSGKIFLVDSAVTETAKPGSYDFVDRKKGYARPGLYDMDENTEESCEIPEEDNELDESSKQRIKRIIENIRAKNKKKLNEAETEESDELTFDDLDLGNENESEEKELKDDSDLENIEDTEEIEDTIEDNEEVEDLESESDDKVEITEFVITVDDVEDAVSELSELGVESEQVIDEEGEPIEGQIKVSAEDWDILRGWLEEKGVDIEEMFGGEIEVEGEENELGSEELEGEEFNLEDTSDENTEELEDENLENIEDLESPESLEGSDEITDIEEETKGLK